MKKLAVLGLSLAFLLACSSSETTPAPAGAATTEEVDSGAPADAGAESPDAAEAGPSLTGECATSFGSALGEGFGRIDGVVYALQMPNDQSCTMPNRDHLIVQVLMGGAVYRMVVNTDVRLATVPHALPAPAFADGWHLGVSLDYPTTLDAHSASFAAEPDMSALVQKVIAGLDVGDPISVYATSGAGRPESAHLVHRNPKVANTDGAIVVGPTSASPTFLLFAFDDQTF